MKVNAASRCLSAKDEVLDGEELRVECRRGGVCDARACSDALCAGVAARAEGAYPEFTLKLCCLLREG